MDPDIDDPNNHVPEVTPGDDWDDLDSLPAESKVGLPPRRMERGLPPKKEAKGTVVNRHEPKSVLARAVAEPGDTSEEAQSDAEDPVEKIGTKTSKKAARKSAKKVAGKTPGKKAAKKGAGKSVGKSAETTDLGELSLAGSEPVPAVATAGDGEGVRLPPAPTGKHNRLHSRIGMGDSQDSDPRPASRPLQKISGTPKGVATDQSDEEIARQRRRYVRGERHDWGEEKGRDSSKWMLYTGVGVVLLVILTVVLSQTVGKRASGESDKQLYSELAPTEEEPVGESADLELLEMLTNSQPEAKEFYGKFATAATPSEFAEFLFNRDTVLPLLEGKWKPLVSKEGWMPDDTALWTVMDREGKRYGVLEGSHPDFTAFNTLFRNSPEGLKLDWKASTGYGTATFSEMKDGSGDGSEIRTWISPSDFYTFSLPEGEFRSFRLMSPDGNSNLWAYTEFDGDLDQRLMKLFIPSEITGEAQSEVQVTLRMEPGPEDGLPNQWMVRDIISLTWLDELQE